MISMYVDELAVPSMTDKHVVPLELIAPQMVNLGERLGTCLMHVF